MAINLRSIAIKRNGLTAYYADFGWQKTEETEIVRRLERRVADLLKWKLTAPRRRTSGNFVINREQLYLLTCGFAGDGKSTLLERLMLDASEIMGDQTALSGESKKSCGVVVGDFDPRPQADEPGAEREQGSTTSVIYRSVDTPRRRVICAETPGHKDFTRELVAGVSRSDLAVLVVDAEKGFVEQARSHIFLCSLLGIHQFVLAVNKMDLVGFNERPFRGIAETFAQFVGRFPRGQVTAIPTSALHGDNVVRQSGRMPWYRGPALFEYLESVAIDRHSSTPPFRLAVQRVGQPNGNSRGFTGTVVSGTLRLGMEILVPRTGARSRISRLGNDGGDIIAAPAGVGVTVVLADQIHISRDDIISSTENPIQRADAFAAHLVWMSDAPLLPGRNYLLKAGALTIGAAVTEIKYRIDIETFDHLAAKDLHRNEIAFVNVATNEPIGFDPYDENRDTGSFVLIDRHSDATVGAGLIRFGLRRAANTYYQSFEVTKSARARLNSQRPVLLWFTGLSGAGKSTIANHLERKLHALGKRTFVLDGDNVRHGLNRDLGFTEADRVENIRRVAEVAKLFVEAGIIALVSFISPFRAEREMARALVAPDEFVEIFVNTPLEACEQRDPKGLYRKARRGELRNFTGLDSPYEPPASPDLVLDGLGEEPGDLADRVIDYMRQRGMLS
jgi:bifunctional enzyme CysN/CysC